MTVLTGSLLDSRPQAEHAIDTACTSVVSTSSIVVDEDRALDRDLMLMVRPVVLRLRTGPPPHSGDGDRGDTPTALPEAWYPEVHD